MARHRISERKDADQRDTQTENGRKFVALTTIKTRRGLSETIQLASQVTYEAKRSGIDNVRLASSGELHELASGPEARNGLFLLKEQLGIYGYLPGTSNEILWTGTVFAHGPPSQSLMDVAESVHLIDPSGTRKFLVAKTWFPSNALSSEDFNGSQQDIVEVPVNDPRARAKDAILVVKPGDYESVALPDNMFYYRSASPDLITEIPSRIPPIQPRRVGASIQTWISASRVKSEIPNGKEIPFHELQEHRYDPETRILWRIPGLAVGLVVFDLDDERIVDLSYPADTKLGAFLTVPEHAVDIVKQIVAKLT